MVQFGKVSRRIWPWTVVLVFVVVVAGAALASALTTSGPHTSTGVIPPKVAAESLPAQNSTGTSPPTTVAPTTTLAPPTTTTMPPPTTTTSAPSLLSCVPAQFSVTMTTDRSDYGPGEPVNITPRVTNEGGACTMAIGACPFVGTVTNSSGQAVWGPFMLVPSEPVPGCTAQLIGESVPSGWTQTTTFSWDQSECLPPGLQCQNTPVPPGSYSVAVTWQFGSPSFPPISAPPTTITID